MDSSRLEYFKQILLKKRKDTKEERDRLWQSIKQSYDSANDDIRHHDDLSDNSVSSDEYEYKCEMVFWCC